ncbi:MAG: hypothetical protein RJB01_423 [Actinomycetota bacterium]
MADFANLRAGGAALIEAIAQLGSDVQLLPIMPNGVPVAIPIAEALGLRITPLDVKRSDEGVRIVSVPDIRNSVAVVIDDGVETGTAALAAAQALRSLPAARLVLGVPICPKEASAQLALIYDEIIADRQPLARRSLNWHYQEFDKINEDQARAMLAEFEESGSR